MQHISLLFQKPSPFTGTFYRANGQKDINSCKNLIKKKKKKKGECTVNTFKDTSAQLQTLLFIIPHENNHAIHQLSFSLNKSPEVLHYFSDRL